MLFTLGLLLTWGHPIPWTRDMLFSLFLALSLSGVILPEARREALLALSLRLAFFLPLFFEKEKENFCRILSLLGGAIGTHALLSLLWGGGTTAYGDPNLFADLSRAVGLFRNPNATAAFLLPTSLLALDGLLFKRERLLYAIAFGGSLLGIAATYSRGALLAIFASSLLLLSRRFGPIRVAATLLSVLPLLLLLTPPSLLSRLSSVLTPDTSISYRFSLWKSLLRLPRRLLVFGVGEGKNAMLSALDGHLAAGLLQIEHTHSLFLHILLASGMLGAVLFLCLCLRALFGRAPLGARAALFSLLLFGIFDDPLYLGQTEVLFWFSLGLCL